MKMPLLLEHVGVGPKLENKHSIELPFSMQTERKKLFSKVGNLEDWVFCIALSVGEKAPGNRKLQFLLSEICFSTSF